MLSYIARRVLVAIPLLWGVLTLTFVAFRYFVPGDPVRIMLFGQPVTNAAIKHLEHELGLDKPLPVQYWNYLVGAAHFDFGQSIAFHQSVESEIASRFPTTLELAVAALLIAAFGGFVGGVIGALFNRGPIGFAITGAAVLGFSIPEFVLGVLAGLIFGVDLRWLPVSGSGSTGINMIPIDFHHIILPATVLALGLACSLTRLIRTSILEVLHADYVRTARAKGVRRFKIVSKHVLRNALLPVVTVFGLSVAGLLSGAVIVENVFALQGLGQLGLTAVVNRDFPLVEGTTFFFALILISANLLVDITYAWIDPRISYS